MDDRLEKTKELGIIALVSGAHFFSHFFVLCIPSALPLIRSDFGASNVSLGLVMAAYSVMAASWQLPMGIFSDRYGARAFLIGGLAIESVAVFSQSMAPGVGTMIALAAVSGIADSVFHPADYTILTHKVRPAWLGRAYSVHTFTGFLGFAMAPLVMSFLLSIGSWRFALATVGIAGLVTAGFLFTVRGLLAGVTYEPRRAPGNSKHGATMTLLLSPPLFMMFLFYCTTTMSSNGIQNFANSAMMALFDVDIVKANGALASYLWGTTAGVLVGGVIADRINRFDAVSSVAYLIGAALLCLVGLAVLPYAATLGALFFVGFMGGVVMPSRDLMVRLVTPPGSIGKAFGYVSSGFGVGGVFGPLVYGTLMDMDLPQIIFFVSAGMLLATIGVALLASWTARRSMAHGLAAEPAK